MIARKNTHHYFLGPFRQNKNMSIKHGVLLIDRYSNYESKMKNFPQLSIRCHAQNYSSKYSFLWCSNTQGKELTHIEEDWKAYRRKNQKLNIVIINTKSGQNHTPFLNSLFHMCSPDGQHFHPYHICIPSNTTEMGKSQRNKCKKLFPHIKQILCKLTKFHVNDSIMRPHLVSQKKTIYVQQIPSH